MKTKNFVVEVFENGEKRNFVVRELINPQMPPVPVLVTDNPADISDYLAGFEFETVPSKGA